MRTRLRWAPGKEEKPDKTCFDFQPSVDSNEMKILNGVGCVIYIMLLINSCV